jgi:thiamine kinase-like enzyme
MIIIYINKINKRKERIIMRRGFREHLDVVERNEVESNLYRCSREAEEFMRQMFADDFESERPSDDDCELPAEVDWEDDTEYDFSDSDRPVVY